MPRVPRPGQLRQRSTAGSGSLHRLRPGTAAPWTVQTPPRQWRTRGRRARGVHAPPAQRTTLKLGLGGRYLPPGSIDTQGSFVGHALDLTGDSWDDLPERLSAGLIDIDCARVPPSEMVRVPDRAVARYFVGDRDAQPVAARTLCRPPTAAATRRNGSRNSGDVGITSVLHRREASVIYTDRRDGGCEFRCRTPGPRNRERERAASRAHAPARRARLARLSGGAKSSQTPAWQKFPHDAPGRQPAGDRHAE